MGLITNYAKPAATNEYAAIAREFVSAHGVDPTVAYELIVATDDGTRGGTALNHKARFQAAVRAQGATARVAESGEVGEDTRYVFVIAPLREYAPRNRAPRDSA